VSAFASACQAAPGSASSAHGAEPADRRRL